MKSFKKMIALLLCLVSLLSILAACGDNNTTTPNTTQNNETPKEDEPVIDNSPLCDGKTLKILAITSSFGLNTTDFLYHIAKAEGCEEIIVARLYASGCTLEAHVNNANEDAPAYEYTKISNTTNGQWIEMEGIPMSYGLLDEEWDIIYLQQSAHQSPISTSYKDYIDQLMPYINGLKRNPNARFIWNQTWAFQSDCTQTLFVSKFMSDQTAMYQAIMDSTQEHVVPRTDFTALSPTGTAIQNARTSYFGDKLTRDTLHLNNLGKAIAGYTLWATLIDQNLTEINLEPLNSSEEAKILTLSDTDKQVIIESVNNAIANPWEVTPSVYTEKP